MNAIRLVIRLAKVIRTPEQAIVVFVVCGVGIAISYAIPADSLP